MTIEHGRAFGTATIEFGEDETNGYLVCHGSGDAGDIWAVSRSWDVIQAAGMYATYGEIVDTPKVGHGRTQMAATAMFAAFEADDLLARTHLSEEHYEEAADQMWRISCLPEAMRPRAYRALGNKVWLWTRPTLPHAVKS